MTVVAATHPPPAAVSRPSLEAAFAAHHTQAVRLAWLLCGDRDQAEDIAATVWLKVHRRLESGASLDDVGAYVRRAVVNESNSWLRKLGVRRAEARVRKGDLRGQRGHDDQVADTDAIVRALATLSPKARAAVVLRYYADLSVADTAAALGISEGTVKSTVSRGLQALRAILEEDQR